MQEGIYVMRRFIFLLYGLILSGITLIPVLAADCPTLVKQALAATDTICHDTGKNEACYGNIRLKATPISGTENFTFSQPGDHVNLSDIKSLQLSPMTIDTGEWGVALMKVEASTATTKPSNVTLLAFGDVTLENTVPKPTNINVSVKGKDPLNVRLLPNPNAGVIGTVKPQQPVTAVERLDDNSWLRVKFSDSEQTGWIKTDFLDTTSDINKLNVVKANQPHYQPMQAFTFKSGSESQNCAEIPKDGLIIQTPEGAGEVQLWINQVVVKLGSTVYFQAQPAGDMTVTTVEGHATVIAMGVTQTAVAGSSVRIKLDADMNVIAPPTPPQAYTMNDVANLPVENLSRKITIHAPLTDQELIDLQQTNCPGNSCNNNGNGNANNDGTCCPSNGNSGNNANGNNSNNNSGGNSNNCPGNSCNSNGNGGNSGNCPGNSCNNNGNNGNGGNSNNCPGNSCNNNGNGGNSDTCTGNSCNKGNKGG
jgi:uncharacterized protein YgiM (DUF1202 family)